MKDSYYIRRTLELAQKGAGYVSPNPLVGAVIVKDGNIIAEGYHEKFGDKHAEINAIENANQPLENSTLYTNLEPCSHYGKTPPCVDAIIKSGIQKVVIGDKDPNPLVNGKGIEILRSRKVKVKVGIEIEKCRFLNRFYYKYIKTKIPYVAIKIAQSVNGKISYVVGKRSAITGNEALRKVHKLRSEFDSVIIGKTTAIVDNPQLDVRLCKGKSPRRYILDPYLEIPEDLKIINNEFKKNIIIVISEKCDEYKIDKFKAKGIELVKINEIKRDFIDLYALLKYLGESQITSLLVEGGAEIFSEFIKQKLVDYFYIFISPVFSFGGKNTLSDLAEPKYDFKFLSTEKCGNDILVEGSAT